MARNDVPATLQQAWMAEFAHADATERACADYQQATGTWGTPELAAAIATPNLLLTHAVDRVRAIAAPPAALPPLPAIPPSNLRGFFYLEKKRKKRERNRGWHLAEAG